MAHFRRFSRPLGHMTNCIIKQHATSFNPPFVHVDETKRRLTSGLLLVEGEDDGGLGGGEGLGPALPAPAARPVAVVLQTPHAGFVHHHVAVCTGPRSLLWLQRKGKGASTGAEVGLGIEAPDDLLALVARRRRRHLRQVQLVPCSAQALLQPSFHAPLKGPPLRLTERLLAEILILCLKPRSLPQNTGHLEN